VTKIQAERVLDAPNMIDDFYLNLLDWSQTNVLAIALRDVAYLMDVSTKNITAITPTLQNANITSLSWMNNDSGILAIGLEDGTIELWDTYN
jgi:cell division cycle protein 20 (cofactor of APC complex)